MNFFFANLRNKKKNLERALTAALEAIADGYVKWKMTTKLTMSNEKPTTKSTRKQKTSKDPRKLNLSKMKTLYNWNFQNQEFLK